MKEKERSADHDEENAHKQYKVEEISGYALSPIPFIASLHIRKRYHGQYKNPRS
jgi:hypothetical protein